MTGRKINKSPAIDYSQLVWQKDSTGAYLTTLNGQAINHYFSIAKRFDGRCRLFRNTYGYIGDFKTLKKAKAAAQYLQDNCMAGWI